MGLLDTLKQYADPAVTPTGDVYGHFDTVAQQATPSAMGSGIAAAMRSAATPPLGQIIGGLFGQSSPEQKAGALNEILQVVGAAGLGGVGGGILSKILSGGASGSPASVTPTQAAQVSPADAGTIAASAEQYDGCVVDRLGAFYAQHPTLVKTLGVAALGAVMSHMSAQPRV